MMEFFLYFSKHRKVGHWFLKPLDEIIYSGNILYFPKYMEGDSLSGVWRQTRQGAGKHRPSTTIRYLDEEIKKAVDSNQYNRTGFLCFLLKSWQNSFYRDKKFLHIDEF